MKSKWMLGMTMLVLAAPGAQAAKFRTVQKLHGLEALRIEFNQVCRELTGEELGCGTTAYEIVGRKAGEKWENTLKQLIHSTGGGSIDDVAVKRVSRRGHAIVDAYVATVKTAGRAPTEDALEALNRDVLEDSDVMVFNGGFTGEGLNYDLFAVVNQETDEVLIFSGGYSEE